MSAGSLFARSFGVLQLFSFGVAFPRWTSAQMSELHNRFGREGELKFSDIPLAELSPDEIHILLTDVHERDHFAILGSTPIGVLLWRLYQIVTRDVGWIANGFNAAGLSLTASELRGQRITHWLKAVGLERLSTAAKNKEVGNIKYLRNHVEPGLDAVLTLLDILLCEAPQQRFANLRNTDFSDLLNSAFDYMAVRCDIEQGAAHWNAIWQAYDGRQKLFDNRHSLNVFRVMEILAYAKERCILERMKAKPAQIEKLQHDRIPAKLRPTFEYWLSQANGNARLLREGLIESLLGRVDVATVGDCPSWDPHGIGEPALDRVFFQLRTTGRPKASDGRDVLYPEGEWPWFRADRLRQINMQSVPQLRTVLTLGAVAKRTRLFGTESKWDSGTFVGTTELNLNPYRDHLYRTDSLLREGVLWRYGHLEQIVRRGRLPDSPPNRQTKLLMVEYRDEIRWHADTETELVEVFNATIFSVLTLVRYAFALGRRCPDPDPLVYKVKTGLERLAGEITDKQFSAVIIDLSTQLEKFLSKSSIQQLFRVRFWE